MGLDWGLCTNIYIAWLETKIFHMHFHFNVLMHCCCVLRQRLREHREKEEEERLSREEKMHEVGA